MENLNIVPERGPHAGADLSDDDLHYLTQVVLWELSVRLDEERFAAYLQRAIEVREQSGDKVEEIRHQRDMMRFAAEVMMDIQRLATTEDTVAEEPSTGQYL